LACGRFVSAIVGFSLATLVISKVDSGAPRRVTLSFPFPLIVQRRSAAASGALLAG
jgi:hypothetical protein